jgi:anti-sigma regulatory factor (Ser/Thr protein kinase)
MKNGKLLFEHEIYKDDNVLNILPDLKEVFSKFNFSNNDILKILTAAKEAILNVIKYANNGKLYLYYFEKKRYAYIQLIVDDNGAGIDDIKLCMTRGYSTANTMGVGLNVILNSVDEVRFHSKKDGFYVDMKMYLYDYRYHFLFRNIYDNFEVSMKIDPYDIYNTCGDGGVVVKNQNDLFFAHWDIEGHGNSLLYETSLLLRKYFSALCEYDLEDVISIVNEFIVTHYKFKRASVLVGKIDLKSKKLSIYRLGNINYIIYTNRVEFKSMDSNGLLGLEKNLYIKEEFEQNQWDCFISFSDGINSTKLSNILAINENTNSYEVADKYLSECSKIDDDSSILVIEKFKKEEKL